MKRRLTLLFLGVAALGVGTVFFLAHTPSAEGQVSTESRIPRRVPAETGIPFQTLACFQSADGGMAQYGYALQQSTSPAQTLQTLAEWNSYIRARSQWSLSPALVIRLANADWNARRAGPPTITPKQLAAAATDLINAKLDTLTAEPQQEGFKRFMTEVTPNGALGLNFLVPYISGNRLIDGRGTVTVSPAAFAIRKAEFQQLAPGMLTPSEDFYPGEAMLVAYSVASGDMGFCWKDEARTKRIIADLTGLDMSNRSLYGEDGYAIRRPLNTFLTEPATNRFFEALGLPEGPPLDELLSAPA